MANRNKSEREFILNEYKNGSSIADLNRKYGVSYSTMKKWIKKYNISDNGTGRFSQIYELSNDGMYTKIPIKSKDSVVYALIDNEDTDRCKDVGIWSLTKDGYVINCKNKIYLHRFIMNASEDIEVDHIYHDNLDNRKSKLRFANSTQQKFNTKLRKDNTSGHRGIYWDKERNKWHVNIKNGNLRITKRFDDYDEAVAFVNSKFKEWHEEYLYRQEAV